MSQPYTYELSGHHGIEVSFTPLGAGAVPHATYRDLRTAERSFTGPDQVQVDDTQAGKLVTLTLDAPPDADRIEFSFLVPTVNLPASKRSPVHTVGLRVHHRSGFAPTTITGQTELYVETPLYGEASDIGIHPL